MNPVDKQIIVRKSKMILDDLELLGKYAKMTKDEYLESYEKQLVVERLLERILTRVIDINYHILSNKHKIVPSDYTESFVKMEKEGEIDKELLEQMKPAAGLRNVLAHEYDEIDAGQVYDGMQEVVKYVRLYLEQVVGE